MLKMTQKKVVGLDIGSSSVKMVQLQRDSKGYRAVAVGWEKIADYYEDDEQSRKANTVNAIQKCIKSMGINTNYVVCGVGGPDVAIRCFKFPALPAEEIEQAVLMEAAQVCPFGIEHSTVDYQLLNKKTWLYETAKGSEPYDDEEICGVLVSATDKVIQEQRQLARNANLKCVLMDVDGLALLNCITEFEKPDKSQSLAILNITSSFTYVIIVPYDGLPYTRNLPYTFEDTLEHLAAELNVTTDTVAQMLYNAHNDSEDHFKIMQSLESACQALITDINETIRYYRAQEHIPPVAKVLVCGVSSLTPGLVDILDKHLPGEVVAWNPFEQIQYHKRTPGREIIELYGPSLAVAAGLAMRSI